MDLSTFLSAQNAKGQLRFITCGSVDDGKSTLIGRLLHDSQAVLDDQLAAAHNESRRYGTQGDAVDLALLVDGLQAEREQGITIDVAYRYFETERRKFIAADTPGHEQYTRNMATGASNADLAVILVDARHGLQTQTRRHSFIVSLFGIRHVVLAVNKMDLVRYDEATFTEIADAYRDFAGTLGIPDVRCVPISALTGENVFTPARFMSWYDGPSLMQLLETVDVREVTEEKPFRMPVQWVNRPHAEFRGFSGTIASGSVTVGDRIEAVDSNRVAGVAQILGPSGDLERASSGQAVTLVLDHEIDISRGDMLAEPDSDIAVADQFAAHVVWMSDEPLLPERAYTLRLATASATAQVTDLVHHVDVNTLDKLAAKTLQLNEVGYCKIALDRAIAFDPYVDNRQTGGFILIDKLTNNTVAAGTVDFALRRASNIVWHEMKIDKAARAAAAGQKPCVLWFTGLSGSGKSTVADRLEQKLHAAGRRTYLLDGDNVRHGLNKDLGFTDQDRVENIRRVAEVARLMADAGLIVISSFISPFRSEREMARALMDEGEFIEVFVDTPLEICEQRDPKGLYAKARSGELKNFTGIDSAYEAPEAAEIHLDAAHETPDALADQIIAMLDARG
ncbi:MAG: sulfate adenylyltransferase subunit CysN [Pseudomonadota bacterium]